MTASRTNNVSGFLAYPPVPFVPRSTIMKNIADPRCFFPVRVPVDERRKSSAIVVPGHIWRALETQEAPKLEDRRK